MPTRFRYESDDPSRVQLDPTIGANPAVVSPGDVFEVADDKVAKRVAADKRFRKVKATEPLTTPYSAMTGPELRGAIEARGLEPTGRSNADLVAQLVDNDRVNPQPIGNLGSEPAPLDVEREPDAIDVEATVEGGTEPDASSSTETTDPTPEA